MKINNDNNALRDFFVTMPRWGMALLVTVGIAILLLCILLAVYFDVSQDLKNMALSALLLVVPLFTLSIVAIGTALSGINSIDRLVRQFLEKDVLSKLNAMCVADFSLNPNARAYFVSAHLDSKHSGTSYSRYLLKLNTGQTLSAIVKMNVFNIEAICAARLKPQLLDALSQTAANTLAVETAVNVWHLNANDKIDSQATLAAHWPIRLASGTLQGALAEGYSVRVSAEPDLVDPALFQLRYSIRQKKDENILVSPYLRRYYAEDIAIFIRALYSELLHTHLLDLNASTWGVNSAIFAQQALQDKNA